MDIPKETEDISLLRVHVKQIKYIGRRAKRDNCKDVHYMAGSWNDMTLFQSGMRYLQKFYVYFTEKGKMLCV